MKVLFALGHGQTPVEGRESWDEGETDLKTPDAVEFVIMTGFQCGTETSEQDESHDRSGESSLKWSDLIRFEAP